MAGSPLIARQDIQPLDHYWALEENEEFCAQLIMRREDYYRFIDASNLFSRIRRVWDYYHGIYYDQYTSQREIQIGGEDSELRLIQVNHLRSLVHLLLTYTVQQRPAWDAIAVNSDHNSLRQAETMNSVLDDFMERKHLERVFRRAVEQALVLSVGYVKTCWDTDTGTRIAADPSQGLILHAGDITYSNPSIFDVVYDFTQRVYEENQWILVRVPKNRWDLVAKHARGSSRRKEDILNASEQKWDRFGGAGDFYLRSDRNRDLCDVWEFYHLPSLAIPNGRKFIYMGSDVVLEDDDYPYETLPVTRVAAGEFLLTSFAYTPAFDLAGLQEFLNGLFSSIVTGFNALSPQKVWIQTGDNIGLSDLDNGVTLVQSDTKPEPLNLQATPPETTQHIALAVQHMEYISGINSVARGQAEENLRSGTALALIDQKAAQFASILVANVNEMMVRTGTCTLHYLKKNAKYPRVIQLAGINGRQALKEFTKEDIAGVEMVRIKMGNPLSRTIAGRVALADQLLEKGLVKNAQEYLLLLETGQIKPMTKASTAQLQIIHEENEALLRGEPVEASQIDNQVLHVLEHQAIADSLEIRRDPTIYTGLLAHILQHVQLMSDPSTAMLQVVLGYPNPLGPPPGMGGTPASIGAPPPPGGAAGNAPPEAGLGGSERLPGVGGTGGSATQTKENMAA